MLRVVAATVIGETSCSGVSALSIAPLDSRSISAPIGGRESRSLRIPPSVVRRQGSVSSPAFRLLPEKPSRLSRNVSAPAGSQSDCALQFRFVCDSGASSMCRVMTDGRAPTGPTSPAIGPTIYWHATASPRLAAKNSRRPVLWPLQSMPLTAVGGVGRTSTEEPASRG